ncbi:hypothetical protein RJ639_019168 [Escallonia herrerae]|uniref:Uncharacterized protein n=1 Tax=Escallonia herrerae TaxID=1293975 RepID=A0AA89AK37_9ASTE|nr:hypothetical protein RJ639_019168 [Escallonia herrerae]
MAAYTGSTKTFSSSDIERATDNFNTSRILGEGGFGRVYSSVLKDGTKVAVKHRKSHCFILCPDVPKLSVSTALAAEKEGPSPAV